MNEYNERIMKNVLEDIFEEKDKEYLKEIEEANKDSQYVHTPEQDKAFYNFLDKELNKANRKKNLKRNALRVASIVAVICVGFTVLTFTVHGFREKVLDFFVDMTSNTHFSLMFSDNDNTKKLYKYKGKYIPSYIPEGYMITNVGNYDNNKFMTMEKDEYYIVLKEFELGAYIGVDNENIESEEKYIINDNNAILLTESGITSLIIYYPDRIVLMNTNDTNFSIVDFSKSIEMK